MPGIPGSGGPPPKRSDQRRRRNKPDVPVDKAPAAAVVEVPPADERWHSAARGWYESLARSGQSAFYEPSDWATAYLIAESMSRDLKPQFVGVDGEGEPIVKAIPMRGASLAAYLKAMTALMVTEGDRRRARLELQRGQVDEPDPSVPNLDDFRDRLSG